MDYALRALLAAQQLGRNDAMRYGGGFRMHAMDIILLNQHMERFGVDRHNMMVGCKSPRVQNDERKSGQ